MEIWREIKGFEGRYQVSNLGRVKSLKRRMVIKDRILRPFDNNKGYKCGNFTDGGLDYIRRGGNTADMEDRCEWKDKV